jgi:hypothetical protein
MRKRFAVILGAESAFLAALLQDDELGPGGGQPRCFFSVQGGAIFGFRDFGFRLTIDYAYRIHLPLELRVTGVGVASP